MPQNVGNQIGEPVMELRIDPDDMRVLNTDEIKEKVINLGKKHTVKPICICPSHNKRRKEFLENNYFEVGMSKKTQNAGDQTVEPVIELRIDPDSKRVLNPNEIKDKVINQGKKHRVQLSRIYPSHNKQRKEFLADNSFEGVMTKKPLNAGDQTGEPVMELRIDPDSKRVLNPDEIKDKMKNLGKKHTFKSTCICPSHNKRRQEFLAKNPIEKGTCKKENIYNKKNFNSKCGGECIDLADPVFEVQLQNANGMYVINSEEINKKIIDIETEAKERAGAVSSDEVIDNPQEVSSNLQNYWTSKLYNRKNKNTHNKMIRKPLDLKEIRNIKSVFSSFHNRSDPPSQTPNTGLKINVTKKHSEPCTCIICAPKMRKDVECKCRSFISGSLSGLKKRRRNNASIANVHKRNGLTLPPPMRGLRHIECDDNGITVSVQVTDLPETVEENTKETQIKPSCLSSICAKIKRRQKKKQKPHLQEDENKKQKSNRQEEKKNKKQKLKLEEEQNKKQKSKREEDKNKKQKSEQEEKRKRKEQEKVKKKMSKEEIKAEKRQNKEFLEASNKFQKEKKHKEELERNERIKMLKREEQEMIELSKHDEIGDTNCIADFLIGLAKMGLFVIKGFFSVLFKIIFDPKGSFRYTRQRLRDPKTTIGLLRRWSGQAWRRQKFRMNRTIKGSETMSILKDELQESDVYKAFANKGKTDEERQFIESRSRRRQRRIRKRKNKAVFGCRHMLLSSPCELRPHAQQQIFGTPYWRAGLSRGTAR
uniref:Uncharacterized protein n=1 Tax=Heliothis virescens TaxID=7102 RepID=A0A2A4JG27_HELVI